MEYIKLENLFNINSGNRIINTKLHSNVVEWLRNCLFDIEVKEKGFPVQIKITTSPEVNIEYSYSIEELNHFKYSIYSFTDIYKRVNESDILKAVNHEDCTCYLYGVVNNSGKLLLHDVKINDSWKNAKEVSKWADLMGIEMVPYIGKMTIIDAIRYIDNKEYLNGIALKTPIDIRDSKGNRFMYKIESSVLKNFKMDYNIPVTNYLDCIRKD